MKSLPIHSPIIVALTYHYDSLLDYVRRNFTYARTDHQFAHEVIHDVCIALIDSPPAKNIHTPLAFLRLAIKNRAIDRCRNEQTRQRYVDYVSDIPDHHQHNQDGANALDFSQKFEALKGIIEALPPRQRQVFLLHRLHEMPQQEIAHALSISRNMVTQHFNRAVMSITQQWQIYSV